MSAQVANFRHLHSTKNKLQEFLKSNTYGKKGEEDIYLTPAKSYKKFVLISQLMVYVVTLTRRRIERMIDVISNVGSKTPAKQIKIKTCNRGETYQ